MLERKPATAAVHGNLEKRGRKRARKSRSRHLGEAGGKGDATADDDAVLATLDEAGRKLKLSRMTLHNLIVAGELRVRRFGRAVRIPTSEIKRLGTPGVSSTIK